MVDLYVLVLGGFYHPLMKGSNSIKSVLPAILASSDFLKAKYTDACYGTEVTPSLNFKEHAWLLKEESGNWSYRPIFNPIFRAMTIFNYTAIKCNLI